MLLFVLNDTQKKYLRCIKYKATHALPCTHTQEKIHSLDVPKSHGP